MFIKKTAIFLLLLSLLASPFSIWAEEPSIDELSATQVEDINNIHDCIEYYRQFMKNDNHHYGTLTGEVQTTTTGGTQDITETLYDTGSLNSIVQYRYYFVLTDIGNKIVFSKNENDSMAINTIELANENVDKLTLPVDTSRLQSLIDSHHLNPEGLVYYYSPNYDSYFIYFPQSEVIISTKQSHIPFNNSINEWEVIEFEDFRNLNKSNYDERNQSIFLQFLSFPIIIFVFAIGAIILVMISIFYKKEK